METEKIDREGKIWGSLASRRSREGNIESGQNVVPKHRFLPGTVHFDEIDGRMFPYKASFSREQVRNKVEMKYETISEFGFWSD